MSTIKDLTLIMAAIAAMPETSEISHTEEPSLKKKTAFKSVCQKKKKIKNFRCFKKYQSSLK